MSLMWNAFRDQIRRSVLADSDKANWSDEILHDCMGWALQTFAHHTCLIKKMVYDVTTLDELGAPYNMETATSFALPEDMYEPLDVASHVVLFNSRGESFQADPLYRTPGITPGRSADFLSYWEEPTGYLRITNPVGVSGRVELQYFAYYDIPEFEAPDSILRIPVWAHKPISILVGAYALDSVAVQSATIDRWKTRDDSGNPESNALRVQQAHMLKLYEQMVAKQQVQDRTNFFREHEQRGIRT